MRIAIPYSFCWAPPAQMTLRRISGFGPRNAPRRLRTVFCCCRPPRQRVALLHRSAQRPFAPAPALARKPAAGVETDACRSRWPRSPLRVDSIRETDTNGLPAPPGPPPHPGPAMSRNFLVVDPEEGIEVLKGLASPVRVRILKLLHVGGALNVNDIAEALGLPQSTVSSNVQILEEAGLIRTETQKARKGNQKICHSTFDEVLVMFKEDITP